MNEVFTTASRIFLVEERSNPSTDYYLRPFFSATNKPVMCASFTDLPSRFELKDAIILFVRYVPPAWKKLVEENRSELKELILFMDDDVLDFSASAGMPMRYRYKLARLAALRKSWLQHQRAQLWVSTSYLRQKYAAWSPKLIDPVPLNRSKGIRRFFYHGSASHNAEIKWLRPIVEDVLRQDESFAFEIIGGTDVYRLYKDLNRVTVVHPMKWKTYRSFLDMPGRHVGLAPQLGTPFNLARSHTKFFDITRSGAVGVYSPNSACADLVKKGAGGLIVELQPIKWVEAIGGLLRDENKCQELFENAFVATKTRCV